MPQCECGCGKLVRIGKRGKLNRFVQGHHGGGWTHSEEWKKNKSEQMMGNQYALGHKHTEEWKLENSKLHKGKKHALGMKHTEEWKRNHAEKIRGNKYPNRKKRPEECDQHQSEFMMGKKHALGFKHTEEWKRDNAERMMGNEHSLGHKHTEEFRKRRGEISKELWSDPEYRDRTVRAILKGNHTKPNKTEIKLLNLLKSTQPGDWKYVGDGSLIIAGKNPDFVNSCKGAVSVRKETRETKSRRITVLSPLLVYYPASH